jgi:ABC-2 type transport system permease protein
MKYLRILAVTFQDVFQQRARNFVWFLDSLINPIVLLFFWHAAFTKTQNIGGWSGSDMFTYYMFIVVASGLIISHVEVTIGNDDIKDGLLNAVLLKPISYFGFRYTQEFPWRFSEAMYGIIMVLAVLILRFPIVIAHNSLTIVLGIYIVILASLISFFYKMILGLLAFWVTDTHAIEEVTEVITIFCAGSLLPVDLLPGNVKPILDATPFPYMIYYPVSALMGKLPIDQIIHVVLVQACWCVALFVCCKLMWWRGVRRYSGVGM